MKENKVEITLEERRECWTRGTTSELERAKKERLKIPQNSSDRKPPLTQKALRDAMQSL